MVVQLQAVNYLAVIVAAVVSIVLGFIWYGPLFSKAWFALTKRDPQQMGNPGPAYGVTFVAALVTAFVLAQIVAVTGAKTVVDGVIAGALVWLGFQATLTASGAVFEGRPARLWALNNGFNVLSLAVMGAILAVWK